MRIHLLVTLGLALALILLVSGFVADGRAAASAPCDRWVVAAGADTTDCKDQTHPCQTVQYAIDQASDGDRICVADNSALPDPTVYHERLVINRSLTLDGKWQATCAAAPAGCTFTPVICTPAQVVLDAQGLASRVITIDGPIAPTIDCFTITNGDAAGQGGDPEVPDENDAGGGIYSRDAAPIIVNNVITHNFGCSMAPHPAYGRGGGIYLLNAPATAVISANLIAGNVADNATWGEGGGIMLRDSDAQVRNNNIQNNRAGWAAGDGGGIAVLGGVPIIAGNKVAGNLAGQAVMGLGGGIWVWSSTTATIEHNLIEQNRAISGSGDPILISAGGGIYYSGDPTVVAVIHGNTIRDNLAAPGLPSGRGGGIYLQGLDPPSLVSDNSLESNIAGFNHDGRGGGLYVRDSKLLIRGNDLDDNSATWAGDEGAGGGVYLEGGSVALENNTITGNFGAGFPGFPSDAVGYGGGVAISDSLTFLQANLIMGNSATNAEAAGLGGGIFAFRGRVRIEKNVIAKNRASPFTWGYGGGVYLQSTVPVLNANAILDNLAATGLSGQGGGVWIAACEPFTLTNNIIAHNNASQLGSGVLVGRVSTGKLAHNTIADNHLGDGVGVYVNVLGEVLLLNNIVVGHTTGIVNGGGAGSTVTADHTLFESNTTNHSPTVTSVNEVPGPAALLANYHIAGTSGAIDHALALTWVRWDIDGDWRPAGHASDVGADEYAYRVTLPLVLRTTLAR